MDVLLVNGPHFDKEVSRKFNIYFSSHFSLQASLQLLIEFLFLCPQCYITTFHSQPPYGIVPPQNTLRVWVKNFGFGFSQQVSQPGDGTQDKLLLGGPKPDAVQVSMFRQPRPGCVHLKPSVPTNCCAWQTTHTPFARLFTCA